MEDSMNFASHIVLDIKPASNGDVMLICSQAIAWFLRCEESCTFLGYSINPLFPMREHLSPIIFTN